MFVLMLSTKHVEYVDCFSPGFSALVYELDINWVLSLSIDYLWRQQEISLYHLIWSTPMINPLAYIL